MLVLDSGETDATRTVLSGEITSEDSAIKPISDKIPIVQLAPGQKIKVEVYVRLGKGTEHSKWNSANVSTLTETDREDEHVLTVETTGALNPEQIILSALNELSNRVSDFKNMLEDLKE